MSLGFASISEAWGEPVSTKKKKIKKDPLYSLYQQSQVPSKELDEDFMALLDEDDMVRHGRKDGKLHKYNRYSAKESRLPYNQYIELPGEKSRVIPTQNKQQHSRYAVEQESIKSPLEDLGLFASNDGEVLGYDSEFSSQFQEYDQALKTSMESCESDNRQGLVYIEEEEEAPRFRDTVYVEDDPVFEEESESYPFELSRQCKAGKKKRYIEEFDNNEEIDGSLRRDYLTTFLYIVSGIFVIFMMEQILRIGMKLR